MTKGISYSVRRKGLFRWEWRAYLPDGRVAQGRRLSARAAKRAAVISALAGRLEGAPAERNPQGAATEDAAWATRVRH